jgi:hypothetical protein
MKLAIDGTPIPAQSRCAMVRLLDELRRRFGGFPWLWSSRYTQNEAVKVWIIAPLAEALGVGTMESLHTAAGEPLSVLASDGTDLSILRDLKARIRVIEFEALWRRDHNGAPFPP